MQNLKNQRGQGLVEYILIVGLMGVLAIAAVNALSTKDAKRIHGRHKIN